MVAAQYIGQRAPEKACRASNQLILAVLAVSGVLTALSLAGNEWQSPGAGPGSDAAASAGSAAAPSQ